MSSTLPFADPLWLNRGYSPYYKDSHRRLQREVRSYIDTHIAPYCEEWEKNGSVPVEVHQRHAALGYTAATPFPLATNYLNGQQLPGGIQAEEWDGFHDLILIDEIARCGYLGVIWALGCGNSIGGPPVINFGNKEQKDRFLPDMLTGNIRFCLGVTEPDAGSDVAGITTTAERKGDKYIVNGAKKWITNGIFADYCTAAVRTGGGGIAGVSALVIPLNAPGVTRRKIDNSGVLASGSTYIEFDDVEVPVANLLGEENKGFPIIMNNFNHERLWLACTSLRMARVCAEDAYQHAVTRETFGKKLIESQVIRAKFAAMGRSLDSTYAWMEQLVYMAETAKANRTDAAMGGLFANLKVLAGRTLEMVNREAQQILGGLGYSKNGRGARIEQISRDVRVMVVGGGSEEILSDLAVSQEIRAMLRLNKLGDSKSRLLLGLGLLSFLLNFCCVQARLAAATVMDHDPNRLNASISKRIRHACASCRRRKTKCSGERPVCFHCRRSRQRCVYEPYAMTIGDTSAAPPPPPAAQDNSAILQRISMLESRLADLSDRAAPQALTSPPKRFDDEQCSLPPSPVLQSVVDTFFVHVHNRPYSCIQEASFRRKLEMGIVPHCLLLAVLASAIRFSTHEYYEGRKQEAMEEYAKRSWMSVVTEHLTVVDNPTMEVVQTANLLAIVDYTVGHVSSAWLKVGLAARISQDLRLMIDPSDALSPHEQEERRQVFWSGYLLDRLISCGKSRPLCFHDDDCHVRLPCDEKALYTGRVQTSHTLHELLCWDSKIDHDQPPSPFGLVILMASIFGRCTRYVYRECNTNKTPPWDTNSEFSKINSSLLLFESYSRSTRLSAVDTLRDHDSAHRSESERVIFAHTLFHLSHCLLNHPFLLRLRLKPFGSKVPTSFGLRVLHAGAEHAHQLLDLLRDANEAGFPLESSFYSYCIVVVGGIQSLAFHYQASQNDPRSSNTLDYFHQSLSTLERLAGTWGHATNMTVRLREFHAQAHILSSLFDPACVTDDLNAASVAALWTMLDYGKVGSRVSDSPNFSDLLLLNMPSPSSWVLGSDIFHTTPLGVEDTDLRLLDGLAPATHFSRKVDTLLDPLPSPSFPTDARHAPSFSPPPC